MAYLVKHILELILSERRALDVLDSAQFACHSLAILLLDRCHSLLRELIFHRIVFSKIDLSTNDKAGNAWAVVMDLWEPFLADVLERGGGGYGEADEEDIGLWVRQGSETVVILLSSSIEETKGIGLVTNPLMPSAQPLDQ